MFIGWNAQGKTQRNLALNAAPINVADLLRQRLFNADTSVIMTSATLAVGANQSAEAKATPLLYFARQVGGEKSGLLQAGSPFDYERQMKLFVAGKMPDPRDTRSTRTAWFTGSSISSA